MRRFSANLRYLAAVFALALAFILPVITFVEISGNSFTKLLPSENITESYAEQVDKNFQRAGNFPQVENVETQITKSAEENVFASIKGFQNYFNENFSNILPFVVSLWFFGVMLFAFRLIGGFWQLHLYKTREVSAPNAEWQRRFSFIYKKLKITRSVKFLQSNLIQTPVVVGWLKPLILVPAERFFTD